MGILALYDTVSIQKYIYQSNRLRDNQGASKLVKACFTEYLGKAVSKLASEKILKKAETAWKEMPERVAFLEDPAVDCEIIYIGGGNALLYLKNMALYKKLNTVFSEILLREVPGITVVSEILELEDQPGAAVSCFGEDMDRLMKRLQLKKMQRTGQMAVPCLSVTRECAYTKQPAVARGADGQWISAEVASKRAASLEEIKNTRYKELSDMAGEKGEQWIAVVHIDGNEMGNNIRNLLKGTDYKTGIASIRKFSVKIQALYDRAYEEMTSACRTLISHSEDKRLDTYKNSEPPFRKIYGEGDDLTFVCFGPVAMKAAELFIRKLSENWRADMEGGRLYQTVSISACAGIVFMKPAFPFARAYGLAEACCKNAKLRAREERESGALTGNYLDFHIAHNHTGNLAAVRQKEYTVTGDGGKEISLLLRPYEVSAGEDIKGEHMGKYSLEVFYQISDFIQKEGIARSKMKELRNAYFNGQQNVRETVARIRRRYGRQMGVLADILKRREEGFGEDTLTDYTSTAVLWDALEMMDLYISFTEG